MYKALEHNEHAAHMSHHEGHAEGEQHGAGGDVVQGKLFSARIAALVVAALAAGLAFSEQGAKHAEIRVQENLVDATDTWAQYQAKSTRLTVSKDIIELIGLLEPATSPELADRRQRAIASLTADQEHYDHDPKDGKAAIAERARQFERARDYALEQTHAYHNGSAALELGIVLATASAIIGSRLLLGCALGIGALGAAFSLAGYFAPEWGAL